MRSIYGYNRFLNIYIPQPCIYDFFKPGLELNSSTLSPVWEINYYFKTHKCNVHCNSNNSLFPYKSTVHIYTVPYSSIQSTWVSYARRFENQVFFLILCFWRALKLPAGRDIPVRSGAGVYGLYHYLYQTFRRESNDIIRKQISLPSLLAFRFRYIYHEKSIAVLANVTRHFLSSLSGRIHL